MFQDSQEFQDYIILNKEKYFIKNYKNEAELIKIIKEHWKELFGNDCLYIEINKKLKSSSGIESIPDGYIIYPKDKYYNIVEVELTRHPLHRHIIPQLSKFISGIKNIDNKKNIVDAIFFEIKKNNYLDSFLNKNIKLEDVHKCIDDIFLEEPILLIIIDEHNNEIEDIKNALNCEVYYTTIKTYINKNKINDHIHLVYSNWEE